MVQIQGYIYLKELRDFDSGTATATASDGSNTPTNWTADDTYYATVDVVCSYTSSSDSYGANGNSCEMNFNSSNDLVDSMFGNAPKWSMYQTVALDSNHFYELSFAYQSIDNRLHYKIEETTGSTTLKDWTEVAHTLFQIIVVVQEM